MIPWLPNSEDSKREREREERLVLEAEDNRRDAETLDWDIWIINIRVLCWCLCASKTLVSDFDFDCKNVNISKIWKQIRCMGHTFLKPMTLSWIAKYTICLYLFIYFSLSLSNFYCPKYLFYFLIFQKLIIGI